tara:strand:- start:62 stop:421 length:360 start_codon:yes stop_codon:yes gene_type:complete
MSVSSDSVRKRDGPSSSDPIFAAPPPPSSPATAKDAQAGETWGQWASRHSSNVASSVAPVMGNVAERASDLASSIKPMVGAGVTYTKEQASAMADYARKNGGSTVAFATEQVRGSAGAA